MTPKSFYIPVGWMGISETHVGKFSLDSNTLVLDVGRNFVSPPFDVERISGSWSPHVPEKKPKYRITWENGYSRESHLDVEPVRLQTVAVGREILVPLITRRPQMCLEYKGLFHGVYHNKDAMVPHTYCGESIHLSLNENMSANVKRLVEPTEPTCKECLKYKSVWCVYSIFSYEPKRITIKRVRKGKTAEERRLRLPTAYARILDDDLFENPTYKPVKLKVDHEPEMDETEDYEDPRDRKRASAIDRNRRLEESKARVQGHR